MEESKKGLTGDTMKCEWCNREVENTYLAYKLGEQYTVCKDCYEAQDEICDVCFKPVGSNKLTVIPDVGGMKLHVCNDCKKLHDNNMICGWCGKKLTSGFVDTSYLGENVRLCKKCNTFLKSGTCRKCGESIPKGQSFNGICLDCMQTREDKVYEEQVRSGLDLTKLQSYLDMAEMSYNDFIEWITGGWTSPQTNKPYNEKYNVSRVGTDGKTNKDTLRNVIREQMIKDMLLGKHGWTPELITTYHSEILRFFCQYLDKLIDSQYIIVVTQLVYNKMLFWTTEISSSENLSVIEEYKVL